MGHCVRAALMFRAGRGNVLLLMVRYEWSRIVR